MSVKIELPPEVEATLAAQAAAQGVPLPEYLRHLIEEQASAGSVRFMRRSVSWPVRPATVGKRAAALSAARPVLPLSYRSPSETYIGQNG